MQEDDFTYISNLVAKSSGIVLEKGKEYLAELRLTPLAKKKGHKTWRELIQKLKQSHTPSDLHIEVIEAMLTHETTFFRDIYPFEAFKNTFLPVLIEKRAMERRLRIWCAASSTGQEPYSIAMLIREHFPQLQSWRIELTATDLSADALARASEGLYSTLEINRGLPLNYLQKYFDRKGDHWQIKNVIRQMVQFSQMNLVQEWPSMLFQDFIFIRNVMIYFDVPTKRQILDRITKVLDTEGIVFLGGAETTLNLSTAYDRIPVNLTSCFRLRKATSDWAAVPMSSTGHWNL